MHDTIRILYVPHEYKRELYDSTEYKISVYSHFTPHASWRSYVIRPLLSRQHTWHTSAYISLTQHTSAYVSIRQHTSAYLSIYSLCPLCSLLHRPPDSHVCVRC